MNRSHTIVALATLTAAAGLLLAGPLNPPAGPVSPSYKTLTDVEPRTAVSPANTPGDASCLYRITQPGSYYLTGNVTGLASKSGIIIAASNVSLDLNGFTVSGVTNSLAGIVVQSAQVNVSLSHGVVNGWVQTGVYFGPVYGARVTDVTSDNNGINGFLLGEYGRVDRCLARNNSANGINCGSLAVVTGSQATGGAMGILVGDSSVVQACTVLSPVSHGIQATANCRIIDSTVNTAGGSGVSFTGGRNLATGCSVTGASMPAFSSAGNNTFIHCSGAASQSGFVLALHETVESCTADTNSQYGMNVNSYCTVRNCSVFGSSLQGIVCGGYNTIIGNQVRNNGGGNNAGIWLQGILNHVEANDMSSNAYGIYTTSIENTIIKNHAAFNGVANFYIAAGNHVGPIIQLSSNATLINGSSGGSLGTTDTNANFVY